MLAFGMPSLRDDTLFTENMLQRALRELTGRLRAGDAFRVEQVRSLYPDIWQSPDAALELIVTEYDTLIRLGKTPKHDEYFDRFPDLRERLERLFAIHDLVAAEETEHTIRVSEAGEVVPPEVEHRPNLTAAGYEILEEIGRGGMGVVFKARQTALNRLVAVKVIRTGPWASPEQRVRMRREAEAVARLQHPNIVQVHEYGECDGQPFLALEYVPGISLEQTLALPASRGEARWTPAQAAAFIATLARAVHHAHAAGIVHRDLKPGNILLGLESATAAGDQTLTGSTIIVDQRCYRPKITDFGLARILDVEADRTTTGTVIGTPSYMAPEQTENDKRGIQPATDVYALGVICYELLTGRVPFEGSTVVETLEQVRHTEAVSPRRLRPRLHRDLETICLKCLQKEPGRRYPTAAALAEDLERFLAGKPILARPISHAERTMKWVRRRPVVSGLLAVILLGAAASFGVIAWQLHVTSDALADRTRALAERTEALAARDEALIREKEQREKAEAILAAQTIAMARTYWIDLRVSEAKLTLEKCPERFRGDEWRLLDRSCRAELLRTTVQQVNALAWTHDGRYLLTGDTRSVHRVSPLTGRHLQSVNWCSGGAGPIYQSVFTGAGGRLLHIYGGFRLPGVGLRQPQLVTCDLDKLTASTIKLPVAKEELVRSPRRLVFAPSFETCAFLKSSTNPPRTEVAFLTVNDGKLIHNFEPSDQPSNPWPVFAPDGSMLAVTLRATENRNEGIAVWETSTGKLIMTLRGDVNRSVSTPRFSADARRMAYWTYVKGSGGWQKQLHIWDLPSNTEVRTFKISDSPNNSVILAPDGKQVAWVGEANQIFVADVGTGLLNRVLRGHRDPLTGWAFRPDGKRLATAAGDGTLRVWDVTPLPPQ